eukprot:NODE_1360_length_1768_cov_31.277812_g1291_i0.p1 GENE.NODE_1360_length_1768_cov_31.277812_g1291_i0~~NODE_1360_length_1768_cov_31.277812_g1291_i0.p1  ORF type:complete len:454 (-),score=90.59 NODE_1360_length_1768_cov_31.277812_g1291_i0:99-1460(-)
MALFVQHTYADPRFDSSEELCYRCIVHPSIGPTMILVTTSPAPGQSPSKTLKERMPAPPQEKPLHQPPDSPPKSARVEDTFMAEVPLPNGHHSPQQQPLAPQQQQVIPPIQPLQQPTITVGTPPATPPPADAKLPAVAPPSVTTPTLTPAADPRTPPRVVAEHVSPGSDSDSSPYFNPPVGGVVDRPRGDGSAAKRSFSSPAAAGKRSDGQRAPASKNTTANLMSSLAIPARDNRALSARSHTSGHSARGSSRGLDFDSLNAMSGKLWGASLQQEVVLQREVDNLKARLVETEEHLDWHVDHVRMQKEYIDRLERRMVELELSNSNLLKEANYNGHKDGKEVKNLLKEVGAVSEVLLRGLAQTESNMQALLTDNGPRSSKSTLTRSQSMNPASPNSQRERTITRLARRSVEQQQQQQRERVRALSANPAPHTPSRAPQDLTSKEYLSAKNKRF